jgi:hemin uptake protein HemP
MMSQYHQDIEPVGVSVPADETDPARVSVETLFDGAPEIRLMFRGAEYRLRITRNGKLILTK